MIVEGAYHGRENTFVEFISPPEEDVTIQLARL
jgi:hypothetical protein